MGEKSTSLPKALFLNSFMVQVWLDIIREAGYTPWVQFCPRLACREIYGLPPKFLDDLLAEPDDAKKQRNIVIHANKKVKSVAFNLSAAACRRMSIDPNEGYLYLDIRITGVACPNIAIPVECIVDVFAKEDMRFGAAGQGWPVFGAIPQLVCLEPDGIVTRSEFGLRYEGQNKPRAKLSSVKNGDGTEVHDNCQTDDVESDGSTQADDETADQRNPVDIAKAAVGSNVVQFKPRSR